MEADLVEVQTVENNCLDMDPVVAAASLAARQVLLDTDDEVLVVQEVLLVGVLVTLREAPWTRASVEVPY